MGIIETYRKQHKMIDDCPPEAKPAYICSDCQDGICLGEEYAEIGGNYYHMDCLEEMDVREVLALFNEFSMTVTEDDFDDGYNG